MQDIGNFELPAPRRIPWNKGKLTGAKPPLRQKHVWAIRTKLQIEHRTRDLALFNLAIDSKLRGCDVIALKVEDVAPNGYCADRATVRQRKTRRPVRFELTEQTRQAVDAYIKTASKKSGEFLFTACRKQELRMTTRQYVRFRFPKPKVGGSTPLGTANFLGFLHRAKFLALFWLSYHWTAMCSSALSGVGARLQRLRRGRVSNSDYRIFFRREPPDFNGKGLKRAENLLCC
jgi:hypothetical protein